MLKRLRTVVLLFAAGAAAFCDTLVVPNSQAGAPGNAAVPLGPNAVRLQEVVGSGQFTVPIVIKGIHVRSALGTGPLSFNDPSFKIMLSTTQAGPNTNGGKSLPSLTYANNVGPDATTVYNAALAGSSPGCSGAGPCSFDIAVPFSTPFSFDPSKGRLLVDFVAAAPSAPPTGSLDAEQFPDTTTSNVYIVTGDPGLAVATSALVGGLVLEFDIAAAGPGPTVTSVANSAAPSSTQVSPGALASIFGSNFGSAAASVTVSVGGKPAYVFPNGVFPTQINVQIPYEVSPGPTTLTVNVNGATSPPFNFTLASYAPALFTQSAAGTGPAAVVTTKSAPVTSALPASPGDTLSAFATGLGPTNPTTPTGVTMAANPLGTMPTLTVGGVAAKVLAAVTAPGTAGTVQINFTVPSGVQGTQPLVLTIGGVSSSTSVTLPVSGLTSIINNASFAPATIGTAPPGSFVTLYVNGIGSNDQLIGFPATKFQGVQVTFNGIPAPLFHLIASASPQQIDLLVPNELPTTGMVNVQLITPAAQYPNYALKMAPAIPGWYRIQDPQLKTRFNVIAQFANTVWLALPASTTAALKAPACASSTNPLSLCGQPATIGDYLVIYATGLGLTTPNGDPNGKPLPTGVAPPADGSILYQTPTLPTVTIGGIATKVLFSGLAPGFPGLYQIDVQVPSGVTFGDDVPVVITIGTASDTATISIQSRP